MAASKQSTPHGEGHTPGPWKLEGPSFSEDSRCGHKNCKEHPRQMTGYELYGPQSLWIAAVHGEHVRVPADQCHANARLIAAAPELLEALEIVKDMASAMRGEDFNLGYEQWQKVHAAIKKARGA